jgi:hypothetical protein
MAESDRHHRFLDDLGHAILRDHARGLVEPDQMDSLEARLPLRRAVVRPEIAQHILNAGAVGSQMRRPAVCSGLGATRRDEARPHFA